MIQCCGASLADWAAVVVAAAAIGALIFNGWANSLVARAQSLQNVYDFLAKLEEHTQALSSATNDADHKKQILRTMNFFEASCHGINKKLFPRAARNLLRGDITNLIAAIELSGKLTLLNLPTSTTYDEIATFVKRNRAAIDKSISEQQQAGTTV